MIDHFCPITSASPSNLHTVRFLLAAFGLFSVPLLFTGCMNPINAYTADKYYTLAVDAEKRGDLETACMLFSRSYGNTSMGLLGPNAQAHALYEYARVCGYTGRTAESEQGYREVLKLIAESKGAAETLRSPALVEFSRMLHDTGQHTKAVPVFADAIAAVTERRAQAADPVGYALILEDYSESLRESGQDGKADSTWKTAKQILKEHQAEMPQFNVTVVYGQAGHAAQKRGDWEAARGYFRHCLQIWDELEGKAEARAFFLYEYGRSVGVLGQFAEAEGFLKQALTLDQQTKGAVRMDLGELALLNLSQNKYAEATTYFDALFKLIDSDAQNNVIPAERLYMLHAYADCLAKVGRLDDAVAIRARAEEILTAHPGLQPKADWTPYGIALRGGLGKVSSETR